MVLLTRPLEQLQKLAAQAGIPYTDNQILQKELQLIRKTNDFEYTLTQWEDKNDVDKTWHNLKSHFHEYQLKLKSTQGPTMQQAGYHHANTLAEKSHKISRKSFKRGTSTCYQCYRTFPPSLSQTLVPVLVQAKIMIPHLLKQSVVSPATKLNWQSCNYTGRYNLTWKNYHQVIIHIVMVIVPTNNAAKTKKLRMIRIVYQGQILLIIVRLMEYEIIPVIDVILRLWDIRIKPRSIIRWEDPLRIVNDILSWVIV